MNKKKGFTLIEITIIVAISILLTVGAISVFINFNNKKALQVGSEKVSSMLKEARSLTLASKNSNVYGVRLLSDRAILFEGSVFSSSSPSNIEYELPNNVEITNINLNGGGSDILFKRLTGETNQYGTTTVSSVTSSSSNNIIIDNTGIIEF